MVDIQIGNYSDIGTNGRQLVSVRMLYDLLDSVDVLANEAVQQMLRDTCNSVRVDKFTLRENDREFTVMSCTSMFQRSVLATYLMDTEHFSTWIRIQ